MKNLNLYLTILLLCTLCLLTGAYGQLTPTGDAYTNTADPTANYGAKTLLDVESSQTTYIQFDLSSIPSGYTGANVTKATLKLYVNAVTKAGSFNVDYVNGTWSEGTITANTAPALGIAIAASVPLTTADKNQYILIDITPAVQAWLNGTDPNDGIALVGNSPLNGSFDSKESTTTSHPAELDVVFAGAGGGIAGINTASGSGLIGGGTSGILNLSLTDACAANQVLQWNGSSWICASGGTGTITGVTAGTDLTGGGTIGNVTLNLNTANVPQLATANTFTGNQTVNGNLSATGALTGSSFQIGSNLFAYGSYLYENAFLGFAGNSTMTGISNTATGYAALLLNTTGNGNTATGNAALYSNTSGIYNVANGYSALGFSTTGGYNTASGARALQDSTTGGGNTADGGTALQSNTTGGDNTAEGFGALSFNTTGSDNAALGASAGSTADRSNGTGSNDTAVGFDAAFGTGSISNATAIGSNAEVTESNALVLGSINGVNNAKASTNVGIGTTAPAYSLDVHGAANFTGAVSFGTPVTFASGQTFPGTGSGTITSVAAGNGLTGGGNSGSVTLALAANTCVAGDALTALPFTCSPFATLGANTFASSQNIDGNLSLPGTNSAGTQGVISIGIPFLHNYGPSGSWNVFLGGRAGNFSTTGLFDTATGFSALNTNTSGQYNTANGAYALSFNTTGTNNTALGSFAGWTVDQSNGTANNNTALGYSAVFSNGSLTNATVVGSNAEVSASNALVLGSIKGVNAANVSISVGIGTTAPGATLDVRDNSSGGNTISATSAAVNNAVYGSNTSTSGNANGAYFVTASPQGTAVVGVNTATGGNNYAGYFQGNVYVSGSLSKGSGSFKIDHPLDPANKYLYHSFVESPDMMNIYNGVVTLDARGSIWIKLPDYFEALNQEFRYLLTSMGRSQPSLYVAREIAGNRFKISGGKPGGKVSWQVTGIRHDAYADAHRIPVEVEKPPQEQGRYLHPELFGAPPEQMVGYPAPTTATQTQNAHVSSATVPPSR